MKYTANIFAIFLLSCAAPVAAYGAEGVTVMERPAGTFPSEAGTLQLTKIVSGLHHPWAFEFLPDGDLLVTERRGNLLRIGNVRASRVTGLPQIAAGGQGGLLDIALGADFPQRGTVFMTYSAGGSEGRGTAVARARLDGTVLEDLRVIWEMSGKTQAGHHFGSRIRVLPDATLLFSVGDRGSQNRAQNLSDEAGKTHRIGQDGSVPADNPFVATPGALPTIYSLGHRNIQGLVVDPRNGDIWATEHGPQGGDEINRIRPGRNYGWPVVTHGREYGSGAVIGEGVSKPGIENPLMQWTPSIAPSGLMVHSGKNVPAWKGSIFSGNLAGQRLVRLTTENGRIASAETLLVGAIGRIRDVREGPDGSVYLLTDSADGALYRLSPARP